MWMTPYHGNKAMKGPKLCGHKDCDERASYQVMDDHNNLIAFTCPHHAPQDVFFPCSEKVFKNGRFVDCHNPVKHIEEDPWNTAVLRGYCGLHAPSKKEARAVRRAETMLQREHDRQQKQKALRELRDFILIKAEDALAEAGIIKRENVSFASKLERLDAGTLARIQFTASLRGKGE